MDSTAPIKNLIEPGSVYDNGGEPVTIPRGPYVNSVTGSIGNTTAGEINKGLIDPNVEYHTDYPWADPNDKWWNNTLRYKWTCIESKTHSEIIKPAQSNIKNTSNKICTWGYIENTLGGQTGSQIYDITKESQWSSENNKTKCPTYNSLFIKRWNYNNNSGNSTDWVEESEVIKHSLRNRGSISYVGSNQSPNTTQLLKQSDVNKMVTIEVGQYLKYISNPTDKLNCPKDFGQEYVLPSYSKNLVYLNESGDLLATEPDSRDSNYVNIVDKSKGSYYDITDGTKRYYLYNDRVFIIGGLSFQTTYDNLQKYKKRVKYCDYSIIKRSECFHIDPNVKPGDGGGVKPKPDDPFNPGGKLQDGPMSGILMGGDNSDHKTELDCPGCQGHGIGEQHCFCHYTIMGSIHSEGAHFPPGQGTFFNLWGDLGGVDTPIYTKSKTYKTYNDKTKGIEYQFEFGNYYKIENIKRLLKDELDYFNNLGYSVRLIVNMYILTSGLPYKSNN